MTDAMEDFLTAELVKIKSGPIVSYFIHILILGKAYGRLLLFIVIRYVGEITSHKIDILPPEGASCCK